MSTSPAPQDLDIAWSVLLESRDALEEVTESCDVSMRDTLNRVRVYRLHKKCTNSDTEVDYGIVAELINQLELLVRDW